MDEYKYIEENDAPKEEMVCEFCGGDTHEDIVNVSMWENGKLILIEDVNARICDKCHEQFYDSSFTYKIDKLRSEGFRPENADRIIEVPVFSIKRVKIPEFTPSESTEENNQFID